MTLTFMKLIFWPPSENRGQRELPIYQRSKSSVKKEKLFKENSEHKHFSKGAQIRKMDAIWTHIIPIQCVCDFHERVSFTISPLIDRMVTAYLTLKKVLSKQKL